MGVFDLFGRDPKTKNDRAIRTEFDQRVSLSGEKNAPVSVFSPTSYADVETIIDAIKAGKNTVVHLTELKTETAVRVLDMLSGAIYALGGGVYEMGKNIFMFSPAGVEVNG
ncbi:MAG: cell division protein SepF [Clostridia bacterium]|nr:cell division protein SepF [Clostridia bacterium]